jgi:ATP-binding cassette subfamily C protein CydCD
MYFDRRMFALTSGLRGRIALAAILGLIALPVTILQLTLTGGILARLFEGDSLNDVATAMAAIVALILLRAMLQFTKGEIAYLTATRMKVRLRRIIYEHVLRLGPGHFDPRRTGDAALSLVDGVESMETFYGLYLPQLLIACLTPIVLFLFMAFLDIQTATIFLVFAIFSLVAPSAFHRMNRSSSMQRRRDYAALGSDFLDGMQGLPTLKVFGQSRTRGELLADRARNVYRSTMWVLASNISTGGIALLGISAGAAVALAWGVIRVDGGSLELRTLLIVLMLGVEVFRPLRDMTILYHQGMMATAAAGSIFELLDSPIDVRQPDAPIQAELEPTIRFENVSFGYLGGTRPALREVSFDVTHGETVAVVGASGAGKSTIVNLLLRFADPQAGRVLVGGFDVRSLDLDDLRRTIAVVAQDTYLFHGTIAENLRIGKPGAVQAELEAVARSANIHDFIASLPAGYGTLVGERGVRLSGGQRQRVAIARALLKDAPILVLDEALSSVDAENEREIQQALERLQAGRTTLVVAHRLSSVVNADQIVVLERGRLVESGVSAELLARGGSYARLMAPQYALLTEDVSVPDDLVANEGSAAATSQADRQGEARSLQGRGNASADVIGRAPGESLPALPLVKREIPKRELAARLLRLIMPWKFEFAACLFAGLANSTSTVLLGAFGALAVGRVATGGDYPPFLIALLIMVPIAAASSWLDSWISHDLAFRLLAEIRANLFWLLDRLAPAYLLRRRSGDLVSSATGDVELIELFYAHTLSPAFQAVLVPGGALIFLAVLSPLLALVLAPSLAAVALTPFVASGVMERIGRELRAHQGDMNAHMVDSVQGLRTVAAFGYGAARASEVDAYGERLGDLKCRFLRIQGLQNAAIETFTAFGGLAVLATGAKLIANDDLARRDLPLATMLALASFAPVTSIVTVAKELMQTIAAARRYFAIEDEQPTVVDGRASSLANPIGAGSAFAFEGVTFRYIPNTAPALENVSFEASRGETVALVGRSGAGKSTAAHLLLRFWDPDEGRITLDGTDVRDLTLDCLRSKLALVAQDTYLFNTSLMENLRFGRPDATESEVLEVARLANVAEFAEALPERYETIVGERGAQLSGGQRQRVAIARALLKDAPVLILDEATSHLDAVNEVEVRDALERLMAGRTTLVIAHRLSTIRNADKIVVLDDGRAVEQGTHAELAASDGLYAHLISHQLLRGGQGGQEAAPVNGAVADAHSTDRPEHGLE